MLFEGSLSVIALLSNTQSSIEDLVPQEDEERREARTPYDQLCCSVSLSNTRLHIQGISGLESCSSRQESHLQIALKVKGE